MHHTMVPKHSPTSNHVIARNHNGGVPSNGSHNRTHHATSLLVVFGGQNDKPSAALGRFQEKYTYVNTHTHIYIYIYMYMYMCIIVSKTPIETKSNIGKTNSYASINQLMGINERKKMKNKVSIAFIFPWTLIHHTQTPPQRSFATIRHCKQFPPTCPQKKQQSTTPMAGSYSRYPSWHYLFPLSFFFSLFLSFSLAS